VSRGTSENLLSLHRRTRDALAALDLRPSRRRGQSFLVDAKVAHRIVAAAGVTNRCIVEIGPGLGALTEALVSANPARLVGIEVEEDLTSRLRERFESPSTRFVTADAVAVEFAEVLETAGPWDVVANLPYSVGTPILLRLLEQKDYLERLTLMLQREVADRVVAEPGSKKYGALSVAVAFRARARRLFHVSPDAFSPRPKVESTVIAIDTSAPARIMPRDEQTFRELVRRAFGQRRKTLRRALAGIAEADAFDSAGIDPSRRGETLSIEEFGRLSDEITALREDPRTMIKTPDHA